jgi:hypothetical protein
MLGNKGNAPGELEKLSRNCSSSIQENCRRKEKNKMERLMFILSSFEM